MNIVLQHISKRFRKDWIFRNVSLELQSGSCHAIIGNNGSGKSTLLQIISGFLSPSEGEIEWSLKQDTISRDELYRQVAMCSPALQLWEDLTLEENIDLFLRFKKLPDCSSTREFAEKVHLENNLYQPLKTYSSGMKQRVKLGLAMLSDSSLLLLDEPCSHLDSNGVSWFQSILKETAQNRTIVVASNRDDRETFLCSQHIDITSYKA
ncbi:MAG: ATP-binding cassette domain-containing protein [Flavobacteriales bacterium]